MRFCGQLCLLAALVSSGYATFVALAYRGCHAHGFAWACGCSHAQAKPWAWHPAFMARVAACGGLLALIFLSLAVGILAWGLLARDFSFDYVARYSSTLLPWQYALSALWVGQAGSLLLWAWMLSVLAILFRLLPASDPTLRHLAFGVLMFCLDFLIAILVFAADPFQASLAPPQEGLGLSPLLQHPSMLIHPPVVFSAYATWTVPFAIALAALVLGRLDVAWTQMARPWALAAWVVLGVGLLLGANWAYDELGWGGYWGWDPVENGSLLPWLSGTALIHGLMAWRFRQSLKKTTVCLAILTFGLCNFATFLTRSGIFSSVHAFSESPIGWAFLGLMAALLVAGAGLVFWRRSALTAERRPRSLLARENLILVSTTLLLLLTVTVLVGTLIPPLSTLFIGHTMTIGPGFYNGVLAPVGVSLLALTAAVPLLRWGDGPTPVQSRALGGCLLVGIGAAGLSFLVGRGHPLAMAVAGLAGLCVSTLVAGMILDVRRRRPNWLGMGFFRAILEQRRQWAGYTVHVGLMVLAIGVTGSALGHQRHEVILKEGATETWSGREIHFRKLAQREEAGVFIVEAELDISREGSSLVTLRPARHLHLLQKEWTTEVAIHSTWGGDFYTVLDAGMPDGSIALTFIENPMMRWLWCGGILAAVGGLAALMPIGQRRTEVDSFHTPEVAETSDVLKDVPERVAA